MEGTPGPPTLAPSTARAVRPRLGLRLFTVGLQVTAFVLEAAAAPADLIPPRHGHGSALGKTEGPLQHP